MGLWWRVSTETDWGVYVREERQRAERAEARLDKALSVLREIADDPLKAFANDAAYKARAAIAEIEGSA